MNRLLPTTTAAAALLGGALFLSATGGAVAGSMVTGKQIKDSSVTGKDIKDKSLATADLSADAVAALHGAAGQPGAPGTPGAAGLSGYQVVVVTSDTVAASGVAGADAICPAGKKALGGGAYWSNTAESPAVYPVADGTSETHWFAIGVNASASPDKITFSLVCAAVG